MIEIDIKSKKYPGILIQVSDIDYDAVIAQKWYISMKSNGYKYVHTWIDDGHKDQVIRLQQFVYRLMNPEVTTKRNLIQKDGDGLNCTRENIISPSEVEMVESLLRREARRKERQDKAFIERTEKRTKDDQDGNDFCKGLEANMKLRRDW